MAAAEERWGRFRRLCNLTHWLRLHGSDEQSVLLPKLISPAPLPSPPPRSSSTSCRADGLDLFIYANSPGVGGVVCSARCPHPPALGAPLPRSLSPLKRHLGLFIDRKGVWSGAGASLLSLSPNSH